MTGLTFEEQIKEFAICYNNPLHFFNYVKIEDATTNEIIPFEMWEHLKEFIWNVYHRKLVVVLKSKQVGISWAIAGIVNHHCFYTGAKILLISKGKDEAAELLHKVKFIHTHLPSFLRLEPENWGTFFVRFKKSGASVLALPSTEEAGVGYTASLVVCDENEFHEYASVNFEHVKPTIDAGGKMIVVSTTHFARGETHFKTLYRRARAGENNFYPMFIPYNARPGRDDEWYEKTLRDYYPSYAFYHNYPRTEEDALKSSAGRGIISEDIINQLSPSPLEPLEVRNNNTYIYRLPKLGTTYVAGVDCSEGKGGDYQALVIFAQEGVHKELVAVIHSNTLTIDAFAYEAYKLLDEYYRPYVVCGADAFGQRFLDYIINLGYPKNQIYYGDRKRDKAGFIETKEKQKQLAIDLEAFLKNTTIHYPQAIRELASFVWSEGGSPTVGQAQHDDLIAAIQKSIIGFKEAGKRKQQIKVTYY